MRRLVGVSLALLLFGCATPTVPMPTESALAQSDVTPAPGAVRLESSPPTPSLVTPPGLSGDVLARECSGTRIDRLALCIQYRDHTPPIIESLGVTFGAWNSSTGRAGAFVFDRSAPRAFEEFGLPQTSPQGPKTNTSLNYPLLAADAILVAPITGIVTRLEYQSVSDDYEIEFKTSERWDWAVSLDHVRSVALRLGDSVAAGQRVGLPSFGVPGYRTLPELQVNEELIDPTSSVDHRVRSRQIVHCPTRFATSGQVAAIRGLMDDWEAFLGRAVYARAAMPSPGCLALQVGI